MASRGGVLKHNPWFKFWPQDWLTDIELRSCSSAQRGTLIDLMCVAHRGDDYGVILSDDTPVARKMLAKCLSLTERTLNNHLTSLLQMSRICRTDDGQLFIKRMVEDHRKSLINSDNGKKGGRVSVKPPLKPEKKRVEKKRVEEKPAVVFTESWMNDLDFQTAWAEWMAHRKEIKKPLKPTTIKSQLKKMVANGKARSLATIEHSISNGWTGLYEPDAKTTNAQAEELTQDDSAETWSMK